MQTPPRSDLGTHAVENQPETGWMGDLWADDPALRAATAVFGGDRDVLARQGAALGGATMRAAAFDANHCLPELVSFDRAGRRLDEVRFHPAYHHILHLGLHGGYASGPWQGGSHVTHAAMVYQHSQIEPGTCCPMTMTYAAIPVLRAMGALGDAWVPKLASGIYDASIAHIGQKAGATLGMAMTEKQGGSDVRANSTRAERAGDHYILTGHKWFCSAPMSDGFLTLAQAPGGLTCFLVPRWLEDQRNAIQIARLKSKLGNRSNASAEIEYHGAIAYLVGEEGEGVRRIIEMVHHTRLDTALAPAGLMRAALAEALNWVRHRRVFQKTLIDQPLMRAVLADLAVDTQAALWLGLRVARAFDGDKTEDQAFARIAVALAKFINNKRCPTVVYEAMEVLGGVGYTDDTPMPMLFRETPLNSIWEGSGNVICLDVLRTLSRDETAGSVLRAEMAAARGQDTRFDTALAGFEERWVGLPTEADARGYVERMADLLTASVLIRHAPDALASGFVTSRIVGGRGSVAGTVPGLDAGALLDGL